MICELAKYMHCSMMGSFLIDCVILEKNVLYDPEKHSTRIDRIIGYHKDRIGKIGHVISYHCILTDKFIYGEWRGLEYFET